MKKIKIPDGSMTNQCPSCGEIFNSLGAFDKHRSGDFGKPIKGGYADSTRRCFSTIEMIKVGMVLNNRKRWISSPMEHNFENQH